MAQTRKTPTPRAPVSSPTSLDGSHGSSSRRHTSSSSHTPANSTVPNALKAPITADSSSTDFKMGPGRRPDSKALPSSRAATNSSTPSATSIADRMLTMNDITGKIPNLLPCGYYQCAGISKNISRCKRQIKNKTYCHSHDLQLLQAIIRDKAIVTRTITQIKAHKGPIDQELAGACYHLLRRRRWSKIHINNFEYLLRNIRKGPLEASERDQGRHALVPRFDRLYVCRGRTKVGKCCRARTVGAFYCGVHDAGKVRAGDVEMAFAEI